MRTPQTPISFFEPGDFVFVDLLHKPFLVHRNESGKLWLYHWHEDQMEWVTLRELPDETLPTNLALSGRTLPREQAEFYFKR